MSELTDQQIFDRLGLIKGAPTCSQWHWASRIASVTRSSRVAACQTARRSSVTRFSKRTAKKPKHNLPTGKLSITRATSKKQTNLLPITSSRLVATLVRWSRLFWLIKFPHGVSISKCVTISSQRKFLLRLSASLVSAQKTTSAKLQVSDRICVQASYDVQSQWRILSLRRRKEQLQGSWRHHRH